MTRLLAAALLLLLTATSALGAQKASIQIEGAEVHQFPNSSSPTLSNLKADAPVQISNDMVRDVHGEYWYKIRLTTGEFGFIRARDVVTERLEREMRFEGMDLTRQPPVADTTNSAWTFVARVMGLGATNTNAFEAGGDAELTACFLFWQRGYLHRMISVGAAFSIIGDDTIISGEIVYRFYTTGSLTEPELRFRLGPSSASQSLDFGFTAAWNYPLNLDPGMQFKLYLEAGTYVPFSSVGETHIWGSAGVGLHF